MLTFSLSFWLLCYRTACTFTTGTLLPGFTKFNCSRNFEESFVILKATGKDKLMLYDAQTSFASSGKTSNDHIRPNDRITHTTSERILS